MSSGRWKYRSAVVTVGENSQKVRELTAGQRQAFIDDEKKRKEGQADASTVMLKLVVGCCIDPPVSEEDAAEMPPDLHDAIVSKIMELSGLKDTEEKKGEAAPPAP